MPRIRWTDRKFGFDVPVELYPEIIERMRGTPDRLAERTTGLPAAVQTARPAHGWSIREHVGHVADLDRSVFLTRLLVYVNDGPLLPPADMTNAATTEANHNARDLIDVLKNAREARRDFVAQLETLDANVFARTRTHPRLGVPMRLVDMIYFMSEHDDHHLATITQLSRGSRES
jgi:uncharacterized damage-inducible protein DinB